MRQELLKVLTFFILAGLLLVGLLILALITNNGHPTPEQTTFHYWKDYLDVFAEFFIAIGTVAVAILAIWGEPIRHRMAGPSLRLKLVRKEGRIAKHPIKIAMQGGGSRDAEKVLRHYHLRIENLRHWMPAPKVRICIQRLARQLHAAQDYTEANLPWDVYLRYSFSETDAYKEMQPNIGAPLTCDILCIEYGGVPKLMLAMKPDSFTDTLVANQPCKLEIQAVGENAVSNKLFLKIVWDGHWNEGDAEMAIHLQITELKAW